MHCHFLFLSNLQENFVKTALLIMAVVMMMIIRTFIMYAEFILDYLRINDGAKVKYNRHQTPEFNIQHVIAFKFCSSNY